MTSHHTEEESPLLHYLLLYLRLWVSGLYTKRFWVLVSIVPVGFAIMLQKLWPLVGALVFMLPFIIVLYVFRKETYSFRKTNLAPLFALALALSSIVPECATAANRPGDDIPVARLMMMEPVSAKKVAPSALACPEALGECGFWEYFELGKAYARCLSANAALMAAVIIANATPPGPHKFAAWLAVAALVWPVIEFCAEAAEKAYDCQASAIEHHARRLEEGAREIARKIRDILEWIVNCLYPLTFPSSPSCWGIGQV